MNFISTFIQPKVGSSRALWFIFQKDRMLIRVSGSSLLIPLITDSDPLLSGTVRKQYLGMMDNVHCYAADIDSRGPVIPDDMALISLRALFGKLSDDLIRVAFRAFAIMHWDRASQFCGQCGGPARLSEVERVKVCTVCGLKSYPRISPAVIVAVVKERQILLGHSNRFPQTFYSVLAGFVEPGETFEECVRREIKEEVGVDIKNIQYFSSQPWPFPDSLMVGFTAEYSGGEICVDGEEIVDAGWFTPENLPEIPGKISISRSLIDWFVEKYG
jgi:NAD+ diphosphatase